MYVGSDDGIEVGELEGDSEGAAVGSADEIKVGMTDGQKEGREDGYVDEIVLEVMEADGLTVRAAVEGTAVVGARVGIAVGAVVGARVGVVVGEVVGAREGVAVGAAVGTRVGLVVGRVVGPWVGSEVGSAVLLVVSGRRTMPLILGFCFPLTKSTSMVQGARPQSTSTVRVIVYATFVPPAA